MTTRTPKRSAKSPEYAVSDEAAAYIADALMELALKFEATHFAQIRQPPRTRPVKAGRVYRGHPKGLALIGRSTAACSSDPGLWAPSTEIRTGGSNANSQRW
jgi:hypothetical protein